jgi:hypothetical protein
MLSGYKTKTVTIIKVIKDKKFFGKTDTCAIRFKKIKNLKLTLDYWLGYLSSDDAILK